MVVGTAPKPLQTSQETGVNASNQNHLSAAASVFFPKTGAQEDMDENAYKTPIVVCGWPLFERWTFDLVRS